MSLEKMPRKSRQRVALVLSLTLGLGLLILIPNLLSFARASAEKDDSRQGSGPAIGLASNALTCLAVGNDLPAKASGVVNLTWQGTVERARLILKVSGAEAAHSIRVNDQAVAQVPIYPGGGPCRDGESFYLDIPPAVVVQGENRIEITHDRLTSDNWTAADVRLEIWGHFTVLQMVTLQDPSRAGIVGIAAAAVTSFTIAISNPYDGSSQEARVVLPDSYIGIPVPLVIYVHGRSSDMYDGEKSFGDAIGNKGWLLASPQLHGSWTGDPQPDPPGKYAYASLESQYDIIGTVSYMLEHYSVITRQIYLMGDSMGGQIAAVTAAKFPHVFAAVFDNKGPTNMTQWYDEQYEQAWMKRECHIGGVPQTPTQNPFCYQRRSGLNFASNYIHIPISITHSISDTLVPIHHSRDLRDAINGYGPDRIATVFEENSHDPLIDGGSSCYYHCYVPDAMAVLNFLGPFTLNNNPTRINITSDESKSYYWLNLVQTGGDHWSQVETTYYPVSATVITIISDTRPLTIGLNLGSTPITDIVQQPGMGLPATTYLVKGGGIYTLTNYTSGYLTTTLATTGQFTLTLSAVEARLAANPAMVSGWQTATSTIEAVVQDHLNNPVPDGTAVQFSTTEGTWPNAGPTYTATSKGGQVAATLTLMPAAHSPEVTARVGSITASTSLDVIHPAIDMLVKPNQTMIYQGQLVTFTYQVTNTGDITLTAVTVADNSGMLGNSGNTVCANITLMPEATTSCSRSMILTRTTTITATVIGQDPLGNSVAASDWATVVIARFKVYLPVVVRSN